MPTYTINCIRRINHVDPHLRITAVGGEDEDGNAFEHTQEEVIANIEESEDNQYQTNVDDQPVKVVIGRSINDHKYIRTEADNQLINNLLSLDDC